MKVCKTRATLGLNEIDSSPLQCVNLIPIKGQFTMLLIALFGIEAEWIARILLRVE